MNRMNRPNGIPVKGGAGGFCGTSDVIQMRRVVCIYPLIVVFAQYITPLLLRSFSTTIVFLYTWKIRYLTIFTLSPALVNRTYPQVYALFDTWQSTSFGVSG